MPNHEYIIVGAGVYGCAVAWELARRGADVLVLEAGEVATGASGGMGKRGVRANRRDPRELPLMWLAYQMWPQLSDDLGANTGYERIGGLNLVEQETTGSTGGLLSLSKHAWLQQRFGIPSEVLDVAQLHERDPDVAATVRGALWCPLDGIADHTATTRAYANAARREGAVIREHTRVMSLERSEDSVTSILLDGGERIKVGRTLLLLNNFGAVDLAAQLGSTLPVWRTFPQALTVATADQPSCPHLIGHDHRALSAKRLSSGALMVTGGWRGRWNPQHERGEIVDSAVTGNLAEARAVYPSLTYSVTERAEASRPESFSVDGIPIIDQLPTAANVMVGTGWTGHGFAIAPPVAKLLSEWAVTGKRPDELAPFAYHRLTG